MAELKTKIQPLEVNEKDPFEGDGLNRQVLCKTWTNFIESSSTPFVLAVDAKWGDGKTTFLKMWQAYLKQQGFKTVFFDAWNCDFYDEALPALIGEIQKQIEPEKSSKNKISKLFKLLLSTAKSHIPITIIDIFKVETNIPKEIPHAIITKFRQKAKQLQEAEQKHGKIQDYLEYQKAVDEFKKELRETAKSVKETSGKPLVIFVDELDRCRPTFAIEVLEKVKHVFDVEFIFFVFAVNKNELKKSINTIYGEIDSERYLQKFFDKTIPLVNTGNLIDTSIKKTGLEDLTERPGGSSNVGYSIGRLSNVKEQLKLFSETFNISLRNQEQLTSDIGIPFLTLANRTGVFPVFLAYFTMLRSINPDLYAKFKIAAEGDDTAQFPFEENLEFYREHAGFPDPRTNNGEIPSRHLEPYGYLCAIYFEKNAEFRAEMNNIINAEDPKNSGRWKFLHTPHLVPKIEDFLKQIDSISMENIVFSSGVKRGE